ncbi:MAG: hypothetical protein IPP93_14995 [Chitinophagaceae bacterium]|nr:hypothetical protein [Chitinophagaceae bacterium]
MQRRKFISNLAVLVPAGMAAPQILNAQSNADNQVETSVLIWGAGEASLFLANELKKKGVSFVVIEPSATSADKAFYNSEAPTVAVYSSKHAKASKRPISSEDYETVVTDVKSDSSPVEIRRHSRGFTIRAGNKEYRASKLVVHAPVQIDAANNTIHIQTPSANAVPLVLKKSMFYPKARLRVIGGTGIDAQSVAAFVKDPQHSVLGII